MMKNANYKNESNLRLIKQMEMEQPYMDFEEQEYQSTSPSSANETFVDILLTPSKQKFIDIITKLKNDNVKLAQVVAQFKEYSRKKKKAITIRKVQNRIHFLLENLKQNQRYAETQSQISILWFFSKFCCSDSLVGMSKQIEKTFLKMFAQFTSFEDFTQLISHFRAMSFYTSLTKSQFPFGERLNYLYYEKYDKLQDEKNIMKFGQTMKNLDEQKKLIVKTQIIEFFGHFNTKWTIQAQNIQKIIGVLAEKPYLKLLEVILKTSFKATKKLIASILKSKIQLNNGKTQISFGPKCLLHDSLKTKQTLTLTAKQCHGKELIAEFDADTLIVDGDYIHTKWSQEIIIIAKEKINYESTQQNLNQAFIKLLTFFKKVFEHRNKHVQFLGEQNKMIEESDQNSIPRETNDYICHILQLFVKFLSFNSVDINHRQRNFVELIPFTFMEELLGYFEEQLKIAISQESEKKEEKKETKNLVIDTIDYVVTLSAHLFYRRDFQSVTAITSKISQSLVRILLMIPNFPYRWAVLRNYKLVIDRWAQSVEQGSQDYRSMAKKFLEAYFNDKVTVYSKSSSTVFNPIFLTRVYSKIFGAEFLKFVQLLEKQLDQLDSKGQNVLISREMNSKVSKIILFLSTRVRYYETTKISAHLSNIYRKYAHIVPEIYLFRSWITQFNSAKINQVESLSKMTQILNHISKLAEKLQNFSVEDLLTPIFNFKEGEHQELLKEFSIYRNIFSRVMNELQIKSKSDELGYELYHSYFQMIKKHTDVVYEVYKKVKDFQASNKERHDIYKEQNKLYSRSGNKSIFLILQENRTNLLSLVRFYVCNGVKILTPKNVALLVGVLGAWVKETVSEKDKDMGKFWFFLRSLNIIVGVKFPNYFQNHLMKKQILGASRSLNTGQQLDMKKGEILPFNEIYSFYEQIKPVYPQLIKLLLEPYPKDISTTLVEEYNQVVSQILQYLIIPKAFISGESNFNGKMEEKSTQDMVLGLYFEQADSLFKSFSVDQLLKLNEKYSLATMLEITKDKFSKISEQKGGRVQVNNLFGGPRANRGRIQVIEELRQVNIPEEYIQIVLENIQFPDAQLALEWIQNNQDRIENLLLQKALKESKQQTVTKPVQELPKLEVGKIRSLKYHQFIELLEKQMKEVIKSMWKQLFSSDKGKQVTDLLFIVLDSFKDDYKKKQLSNFSKKMFEEINGLHSKQKFEDQKYRLVLYILSHTLKKEPKLFNDYYKSEVFLKVLSFVTSFGNSLTDEKQKQKVRKEDFSQLLEIVNKTLPQWKSPLKQVRPELVQYLDCLLDLTKLSNVGGRDVWEIIYKISSLQINELRGKILSLFQTIVMSKQILEEERKQTKTNEKVDDKKKNGLFYKAPRKNLPSKDFMLPLVKILLQQDKNLLTSNIQLQIKGYIAEQYSYEYAEKNKMQEGKKLPLEIDLKRFSASFEKFVGCSQFDTVFKKLFTKMKNRKNILFYDYTKHPLFMSQLGDQKEHQSFLSLKFSPQIEQILHSIILRPLQFGENQRQMQQQCLIELYKFLDYFRVLIPTALRTKFISPNTNRQTNLIQWLICESVALNEKKYHFMTFLTMNNHLFVDDKQSISDWVCHEFLKVFSREISNFSEKLKEKTNKQMTESVSSDEVFKDQSKEEIQLKKTLLNFMYLLQVQKFNAQCFLKIRGQKSLRDLIEELFINLQPSAQPILYTILNEIIFILRKREMIELLKDKYEIHSRQSGAKDNQELNINRMQFLNMSLIYNVDPNAIGIKLLRSSTKKRNIFSGSSRRIIVDEIDDDDDLGSELNWDEMEAQADFDDDIGGYINVRMRQRDQRNNQSDVSFSPFLFPNQNYRLLNRQLIPAQNVNNSSEQQGQSQIQMEEVKKQEKEIPEVISQFDYAKSLQQQSQMLIKTLETIENLLPELKMLRNNPVMQQKSSEEIQNKMISEEESNKSQGLNEFSQSFSNLIQKVSTTVDTILPANSNFDLSVEIRPDFPGKLSLKENIPKLARFDRRFRSLVMSFCPEVKTNVWQNDYGDAGKSQRFLNGERGHIPSARWLLSRLERQDSGENREEMFHHIERIINQRRRQEGRQQNVRPRTLNLNQAISELPEQPEPPKPQEKPKSSEKQEEKKPSSQNVQIKPQNLQNQEKKVQELPVQQKIVEEKPQEIQQQNQTVQKQQKMEEQKPAQEPVQKAQQKSNQNQMNIEEQKPVQSHQEPIIPQESQLIQQPQGIIEPPQQFMNEPEQTGPYRQILAMFGLPQTFFADNGIDPESFDSLPEEFQIDQIMHYMNQAQNRNAINQLNQANQPVQQNANQNQPGQNVQQGQQAQGSGVNDVLQQNIALFASMDPQTRAQMLADYPPEFLMQLPVQMRAQIQQYRQRQIQRIVDEEDEYQGGGLNLGVSSPLFRKKEKNIEQLKKQQVRYPSLKELTFNPVSDSLAEHLSKSIFLKIEQTPVLQGFRLLLQNYLTQESALATIVGILNIEDALQLAQLEYVNEQNLKKEDQKSQSSILIPPQKGYWKFKNTIQTDSQQIIIVKQDLLNLVYDTLKESVYKNPEFLTKKNGYKNYLKLKIQPKKDLEADEDGFWPLYELLPESLNLCPKLAVQILKKVKSLPLRLIKNLVKAIRADKLTPEIYKNLQFLSKNEQMKQVFNEQFPEENPLKLQTFAKVIKYEFARVPYLKKLHEQALNFYSSEYNEFLNQIFGIYTIEDIKDIQSILSKHKHVHFQVIKYLYSQKRVLDKEPLGLILKMPHLLDFETKRWLFRNHPKIKRAARYRIPIEISRTNILQDSFNQVMSKTPKQLEGRIQITFIDQPGYDAGGLTREWLMTLSREIFNPNYALFQPSSSGNTYQPNPKSYVNPDHLQYFKFIGRFVGKALAENELVDAYFTRAFYKMVLGQQIELSDLEQQDYAFYKSMLWLTNNNIQEGDYTFSYLYDNFGQRIVKDLIPGGRDINVTEENKKQYIEKYCLAKMRDDFKVQIEKFLQGFHEIIPHECINFFEAKQLELLISGLPQINFEDLKNNIDYSGFAPTDQAVKWFWQILEEFSQEDLARLIQFITGTSKIPAGGFGNIKGMNGPQRISIHKDPNSHQLPKAHTCFNQLDLPNYESKEVMRERIVTAITWGNEGFGFM